MRLWSWVYPRGSSVGSATTVANRVIKLQSVGVAVRHHAPTEDQYTSRQIQGNRSPKKIKKGLILEYVECIEFFIECFGQGASIWRKFI